MPLPECGHIYTGNNVFPAVVRGVFSLERLGVLAAGCIDRRSLRYQALVNCKGAACSNETFFYAFTDDFVLFTLYFFYFMSSLCT